MKPGISLRLSSRHGSLSQPFSAAWGAMDAPVVVEVLLYLLHLLVSSLLGVFLHTRVDGGVYLQTDGVEVVAGPSSCTSSFR